MLAALAIVAAVAGGTLGVTATPDRPRVGQRVTVDATGFVGDEGHLWLYRMRGRSCAHTQRAARRRGRRMVSRVVTESFEARTSFVPRRSGRLWLCGYLYSNACDTGSGTCAPAVGLPPDAGFSRFALRVRPRAR
jgi:hypothetical protein